MASSSLNVPRRKYDVFLSFRGIDTRRSIVSHLLKALKNKKIEVFSDYKLEAGNEISSALLRAIEESFISLVIFSKGYAESKWCLEELEKIIDCMESHKQILVPIFYDVDPSTVRHQKGCYEDAFRRQEENFKHDSFKIQSWQTSLKKTANLSGFDCSKFENDAELVEQIVNRVWEILKNIMPPNDSTELIGIHEQITELELLLCQRLHDVHIIGIWGMGGIGKTTIASLLFEKLSHEYEGYQFLENVKEELGKCGMTQLKNKLISKLLGGVDLGITVPVGLPFHIKERLRQKKALVVLDDVDDPEQLKDLIGAFDWLGPGSTIIMTSRDKCALNKYCSKIYEVKPLNSEQSLQLFNLHAFKKGCLEVESSLKLSLRVIDYAKGNPLALKVLGSFLNGKCEDEWRNFLEKHEKMPFPKIQSILKLSYDALDQTEKNIFLLIACFFKEFDKDDIISLLDSFLYPIIGLRNLEDKALISIVNKRVIMHNLIQEMGQQIVREESPNDLGKHRHLWNHDDIYEVLENNRGTADIESINLLRGSDRGIHLSPKVFEGMVNLKYLSFNNSSRLHISGNKLDSLPKKLKYFSWDFYPSKSLPSKLCLKNLVQLHLRNSNVRRLWNGTQDLGNLKKINLYGCEFLKELPDMSKASKLEQVNLSYCTRLRHIHPCILSNHNLVELKEFSVLSERTCIENVPSPVTLGLMNSLTILSLIGMKLVSLPASIKHLSNLEQLYLCHCSCLQSIPELPPSIKCLDARGCSSLKALFTSTSSWPGSHLINPPYPFVVILKGCYELGEDTMIDIVIYFMLLTIGAVYHQPTPGEPLPSEPLPGGTLPYYPLSLACIPLNKLPDVFNFQTRKGGYISIQVPLNSDLMAIVFCFAGCILEYRHFSLSCFVHVSNGETMKYFKYIDLWGNPGDHVVLWYNDHFNSRIMNGIKESRALSSPTDEYTKVSFQLDKVYTRGTNKEKVVGVYPIYASELQSCSTNIKRSWAQLLTHS